MTHDSNTSSHRSHVEDLPAVRTSRRQALQASAAAAVLSATATLPRPSEAASSLKTAPSAAAAGSTLSLPAAEFESFRGKGGFTLQKPSNAGWVTAFVSGLPF